MTDTFTEEYLRNLVSGKVQGNFAPFSTGDLFAVENYIKQMLGRLKNSRTVKIEADYDAYGSGFASYISVKISKKDKSDTTISNESDLLLEWKEGLLVYISLLSPYWIVGDANWSENYLDRKYQGGSMPFLRPEHIDNYDKEMWQPEITAINEIFNEYRYGLLTKIELEKHLWFDVEIPTIIADKPYRVFDCFFYWED